MPDHVIKRGLDIPIVGEATGAPVDLPPPDTVAYAPQEFRGLIPKPAVREGDEVQAGSVLFVHKRNPDVRLLSPVAGRVREIRRGHRRVITDFVVERAGDEAVAFQAWEPGRLPTISRDDARAALLAGGLWPTLRTRPLDRVADPGSTPQSILICGTETGPLQPGPGVLLRSEDRELLQAGIHVLRALSGGPVHLTVPAGEAHPAYQGLEGVEVHRFSGPHPSGDPAVQVNLVDPPRGGGAVWWLRAWEAVDIGRLFLDGRFPTERVYAAVGAGVKQPRHVRTVCGAPLAHVTGATIEDPVRWIRGSVLTGEACDAGRWAGFYARAVHVLPARLERELLGWTAPQLHRFSFHRAYASGFSTPRRRYDLRPGLNGGHRALIPIGVYQHVVATPDIVPEFLFRSIMSGDLEESIQLGLLDLSPEEAALCTFVCPSKIEFDVLLRDGLETYAKEL